MASSANLAPNPSEARPSSLTNSTPRIGRVSSPAATSPATPPMRSASAGLLAHPPHQGPGQGLAFLDLAARQAPRPPSPGVLVQQQDTAVLDDDAASLQPAQRSGLIREPRSRRPGAACRCRGRRLSVTCTRRSTPCSPGRRPHARLRGGRRPLQRPVRAVSLSRWNGRMVVAKSNRRKRQDRVKCSVRGDFLFDAAWCSFWAPFHPGIAAADPLSGLLQAPGVRAGPGALLDAAARHHCYELHIGFTHLGWNIWTGNQADLAATARRLTEVLERGPLPLSPALPRESRSRLSAGWPPRPRTRHAAPATTAWSRRAGSPRRSTTRSTRPRNTAGGRAGRSSSRSSPPRWASSCR
jgi:hypothetical protein